MVSPQRKTISEYFLNRGILVVEDRPTMRRTLRTMLKTFGVPPENIHAAGDGPDALKVLKVEIKPFFVLLDLNLPTMTGIEVLAGILEDEKRKDTPVVIVTADNHEGSVAHATEMGARGYIIKPFTETTLKEKISNIINPPEFIETFNRIEQYLRDGEYAEAVRLADVLLEIKPGSPGAFVLRGEAYEGLTKDAEALASYEAAHQYAPLYLRVLKKLVAFHMDRGSVKEGLMYLEKMDKLSPYNAERKIRLGSLYIQTNQAARVKTVLDRSVKLDPGLLGQAAEVCLEERPDLAESYYRAALAVRRDINTINQLGIALRNQGKWTEAVREYELALRIAPNDEGLHFNMGRALAGGGKRQAAIRAFSRALEINPKMKPALQEKNRLLAELKGESPAGEEAV